MKTIFAMFGATRYWDKTELEAAAAKIETALPGVADEFILVADGVFPTDMPQKDSACIILPMSGAVQAPLVEFAGGFKKVTLFAGYVEGNFDADLRRDMLRLNAAPTLMDSWAVLKRTHENVSLALSRDTLKQKAASATGKLLLIGDIEPWVISASRDLSSYEKAGVTVQPVSSDKLAALFTAVTPEEAAPLSAQFTDNADALVEPTRADVETAARLAIALECLLTRENADGAAIACFNLIPRLGTTSCLAVSHVNERTRFVAACEGDLDSAVTMLLMKRFTDKGLWMANPNLQADGSINFAHCTAPLSVCGQTCRFRLRNHHESGRGVSPEVDFPTGGRVTLCRYSAAEGKLTVQGGTTESGEREETCRTQLRVRPDDFARYLDTALGCHQVVAFEDIGADMRALGRTLGLIVE